MGNPQGTPISPSSDIDKEYHESLAVWNDDAHDPISHGVEDAVLQFHKAKKPNSTIANLYALFGFLGNSVIDIATLPFNADKLGDWIEATHKFVGYISCSGISEELAAAFFDVNAVQNMLIIARAQAGRDHVGYIHSRRSKTALPSYPSNVDEGEFNSIMAYAARYVRFATGAYGVAMIKNAKLLQTYNAEVKGSDLDKVKKICKYLGLSKHQYLKKISCSGGDMKVLNHFIAISPRKGKIRAAVVLAIRGTYTISGLKVDAAAYSRDFCGGLAHEGMADAADTLWDTVKDEVMSALQEANTQWGDVDFVVTGHSLGAGTAALLALKLKYEDAFAATAAEGTKVVCYAFAPPPVYYAGTETPEIKAAMSDTYAFIHENDCVPFASVAAVRHLSKTITKVDKTVEGGIPFLNSLGLMAAGLKDLPLGLKNKIHAGDDTPFKEGAEKLAIPAPYVIWMRKTHNDDKGRPMYNSMFCRPKAEGKMKGTNDLNILIHPNMITNHMNPEYERAIYSIKEQLNYLQTNEKPMANP